ncbi:unnamed protein product [Adineta ricciae]|uniref:EGF-like domain-containing protein n=1 Tax=Adineta ricciae TaxID=249248 RepID=A0A815I4Z3_ADIRI|nr:unnamed protein product [Adineta ricciae]
MNTYIGVTSTLSTSSSSVMINLNSSEILIISACANQYWTGIYCNISNRPCDTVNPCQNNGSCLNSNTTINEYFCQCPEGFDGSECQNDRRLCKPNICLNNGQCNETSNETFECLCLYGWTNVHCENKINYCTNNTCENGGVCRPLFLNYTCECLGTSYSGRYCEVVDGKMVLRQMAARSLGYVAIIFLIGAVMFFIIMDILKYLLGIDVTKNELIEAKKTNETKRRAPRRKPRVFQKFEYVNPIAVLEE